MKGNMIIKNASQLVTCSGFKAKQGKAMSDLCTIDDGAVVIENGIITAVGKTGEVLVKPGKCWPGLIKPSLKLSMQLERRFCQGL